VRSGLGKNGQEPKKKITAKNRKPYMCPFGVTQHACIAFRVGLFQSDFAYAYCV
jgi:hypothetical protein